MTFCVNRRPSGISLASFENEGMIQGRHDSQVGVDWSHSTNGLYEVPDYGKPVPVTMSCSTNNNDRYAKGLAISQVLWDLLNNRFCDLLSGSCVKRTISPDMSYTQLGTVARQTLTITVDDTGATAPINVFMNEWWYNLYYSVSWPTVWPLRQVFQRHAVALPRQYPRGVLDSVTPNFVGPGMRYNFSGWACDPDTPANPEWQDVHIYVQGAGFVTRANLASEGAVADACSDPTYSNHRFNYSVTNAALRNAVGSGWKTVQAYAIDSDFKDGNYNVAVSGSTSIYVYPSY